MKMFFVPNIWNKGRQEMDPIILNFEMIVMLGLLTFTVFLFVSEIVRLD